MGFLELKKKKNLQEEHDHEIEAKREKLQELMEFNRTRKVDGTEFLNQVGTIVVRFFFILRPSREKFGDLKYGPSLYRY